MIIRHDVVEALLAVALFHPVLGSTGAAFCSDWTHPQIIEWRDVIQNETARRTGKLPKGVSRLFEAILPAIKIIMTMRPIVGALPMIVGMRSGNRDGVFL
jgi:cellobiose-specific phosphotransferase system component IIC